MTPWVHQSGCRLNDGVCQPNLDERLSRHAEPPGLLIDLTQESTGKSTFTRWTARPGRTALARSMCDDRSAPASCMASSVAAESALRRWRRSSVDERLGRSGTKHVPPDTAITPRLTDSTIPSRLGTMALNIKNPHVERLAAEVAKLARESKTEAIGRALEERKARLASRVIRRDRQAEFLDFLRRDVWPKVPRKYRRRRLTRKEEDALLGYGPEGV